MMNVKSVREMKRLLIYFLWTIKSQIFWVPNESHHMKRNMKSIRKINKIFKYFLLLVKQQIVWDYVILMDPSYANKYEHKVNETEFYDQVVAQFITKIHKNEKPKNDTMIPYDLQFIATIRLLRIMCPQHILTE